MVGMLQIITYLLCTYLVFKGVEILQIALMSPRQDRALGLALGAVMVVLSLVAAYGYVSWIDTQAHSVSDKMQTLPTFSR